MSSTQVNNGKDHGIYVWRDPTRGGYPISISAISKLVMFAKKKRIKRISYDNWGTGQLDNNSSEGSGRQSNQFLAKLIQSAHDQKILVEALYTDYLRFQDVMEYNRNNPKFDGIRLNYEGPWNLGNKTLTKSYEPVSVDDIKYFEIAKQKASGLSVYPSISWHWGRTDVDAPDKKITYNGKQKFAYEHILDITDGVDIQTGWGGPDAINAIMFRVDPIIQYARKINKPAWITIETSDRVPPNQTFKDEGIIQIELIVRELLSTLRNNSPAGVIYHFYMNSYR